MSYSSHNWASVDWSKQNITIAKEVGVTPAAVAYQRGKNSRRAIRSRMDWSDVDWSQTDLVIARQRRCTTNAVRYQRLKRLQKKPLLKRVVSWLKGVVA